MKPLTKKLVSIITAAAFTASLPFALPAPAVDAQIIHWQHGKFDSWDNPDELPSSGSYLLECDVTLHRPIIVSEDLNLCLNGHNIVFKIAPDKDYPDEKTYGFFLTAEANLNIYAEESGGKIITRLCREGEISEELPSSTTASSEETKEPVNTSTDEIIGEPDNTTSWEDTAESGSLSSETEEPAETTPANTTEPSEETEPAQTASPEENQPAESTAETSEAAETDGADESDMPKTSDTETSESTSQNVSDSSTDGSEENPGDAAEDNGQESGSALNGENLALHIRNFTALFKAAAVNDISETDSAAEIGTPAEIGADNNDNANSAEDNADNSDEAENAPESGNNSENVPISGEDNENAPESGGNNENAPASGVNNEVASVSENVNENASVSGDDNENAPVSGNDNENAPVSGDNNENAPISGNNGENAPVSGSDNENAPVSGDDNKNTPISGNNGENAPASGDNGENAPASGDGKIISDPVLISHYGSGELNLYGGILESEGSVCIVSGNNSSVNIYGGEVKAAENSLTAVCAKGNLRVNDGIVSGGIEFEDGRLVISGGKISGGVNVISGNAIISGGLITGENAILALSEKDAEITVCDNAVLAGEETALSISNAKARVYLYGQPVLEGKVFVVPSEAADDAVLSAHCKDNVQKIYTGEALNIDLPESGDGAVFNGGIDGKYIASGVSGENEDKFTVSEEYYSLALEEGALKLHSDLVKITEIQLEDTAVEVKKEITLIPAVSPENYFEKIIWSSNDPEIASVDETGKVTAHRVGTVTVTASAHTDKNIFASCEVQVTSSKVYNIAYDTKGVNAYIGDKYKYYVYGEITELPVPEAVGYSFVGWHRSPDLSDGIVTEIGAEESGDITLYAQWNADDYTLEFVLNGGVFEQDNIPNHYTYGNEDVLPVPVKEGFKFMGWYEKEDFSDSAVYKIPAGAVGNKTYYAKWIGNDANEYSVIFRVDGKVYVVIVYEGETPKYPNGVPAKASDDKYDYEFAGWSPEIVPAYGFDEYEAEFNAIPKSFAITLMPDGGIMENQPDSYTYGDKIILPVPEKEGYSFLGWYLDEEFSGEAVAGIDAEETGDKVYFAKWELAQENPDEPKEDEKAPEKVEISDEIIDIVWPANAKVILNPYKMKLSKSAEAKGSEIILDDVNGITDTVVSPELKFINKGSSEVKVVVTGSVNAFTTAVDSEGAEFTYESHNIDFATEPIKRPDSLGNGGDPNNTILLYLEQAYDIDSAGIGRYSQGFDANNPRQMLLGRETVTREFFTIPASESEEGTKTNVKICGDMSVNPVLSWGKLAKTDNVDINLVFSAVPASGDKDPEKEGSEEDTEKGQETTDNSNEPNSPEENQGEDVGTDTSQSSDNTEPDEPDESETGTNANEPEQSVSETELKEPEQTDSKEPEQTDDFEDSPQDEDEQNHGENQVTTGDIAFKEPEPNASEDADGTAD